MGGGQFQQKKWVNFTPHFYKSGLEAPKTPPNHFFWAKSGHLETPLKKEVDNLTGFEPIILPWENKF